MPLASRRAIRLLILEPAEYEEPLSCKLMRTTLDGCRPYYVLSYAWDEQRTEKVLRSAHGEKIDGEDWQSISVKSPAHLRVAQIFAEATWIPGSVFGHELISGKVTTNLNLRAALRRARRSSTYPTCIWVDMLCMNQAGHDEKIAQLQIMKDILQQASQVIVWLGENLESEDLVCWNLDNFADIARPWDRGVPILYEPDRVRSAEDARENATPFPPSSIAAPWNDFFSRSWFKRKCDLT